MGIKLTSEGGRAGGGYWNPLINEGVPLHQNPSFPTTTIERIETNISNQSEINQLWAEIKQLFSSQLELLPNLPSSNNKKQKKLYRTSQPFWNSDLEKLWKAACMAEKEFISFKLQSRDDLQIKNVLRENFVYNQNKFDYKFRQLKRSHQKSKTEGLKSSSPTDILSTLKKLNNPPSSKAALEKVREDKSISRDLKEVLERWHTA